MAKQQAALPLPTWNFERRGVPKQNTLVTNPAVTNGGKCCGTCEGDRGEAHAENGEQKPLPLTPTMNFERR